MVKDAKRNGRTCGLVELPVEIGSIRTLEELDISRNKLSTLPPFLASLYSLKILLADSCGLNNLQYPLSTLSELRTLSITSNKLLALPGWLCHLSALEYLRVDNNRFKGHWAELVRPICMAEPASSVVSSPVAMTEVEDRPSLIDPHMYVPRRPLPRRPSIAGAPSSSRPSTSTGTSSPTARSVKKMRSTGDLAFGRSPTFSPLGLPAPPSEASSAPLRKSMSLSPETNTFAAGDFGELPSTLIQAEKEEQEEKVEPALISKKKSSFFKKMGSFGRSKNADLKRPHLLADQRSSSAPESSTLQHPKIGQHTFLSVRHRTASVASVSEATIRSTPQTPSLSRSPSTSSSIASSAVGGFLQLGRIPPMSISNDFLPLKTQSDVQEDDESEAEELSVLADPVGFAQSGLKNLMHYLHDLDDLGPDSSPAAVVNALSELQSQPSFRRSKAISRSSSARQPSLTVASSVRSSAHSSLSSNRTPSADGYSDAGESRMPHSSASTHATTAESSFSHNPTKLKSDPVKREKLILEIISSEQSYCAGLQELVDIYITPGTQTLKGSSSKETVIPIQERRTVFSNVEDLLSFHRNHFLPDLEAVTSKLRPSTRDSIASDDSAESTISRQVAEEVAKVFNRHGAFLRM